MSTVGHVRAFLEEMGVNDFGTDGTVILEDRGKRWVAHRVLHDHDVVNVEFRRLSPYQAAALIRLSGLSGGGES